MAFERRLAGSRSGSADASPPPRCADSARGAASAGRRVAQEDGKAAARRARAARAGTKARRVAFMAPNSSKARDRTATPSLANLLAFRTPFWDTPPPMNANPRRIHERLTRLAPHFGVGVSSAVR